jgi:hypothetical protein
MVGFHPIAISDCADRSYQTFCQLRKGVTLDSRQWELTVEHEDERIDLFRPGRRRILPNGQKENSGPYIHPLVAPDDIGILTEDEPDHHPWQHGLYTGLNDVPGCLDMVNFGPNGAEEVRRAQLVPAQRQRHADPSGYSRHPHGLQYP